jgi:hypothetical protein
MRSQTPAPAFVLAVFTIVAAAAVRGQGNPSTAGSAREIVERAIAAMGGEARLTSIKSLTLDTIGHAWALEQSERPEGPWLAIYRQRIDVRDYERNRRSLKVQQRFWSSAQWNAAAAPVVVTDGVAATTNGPQWRPAPPAAVRDWDDVAALSPERILLTARQAADLRAVPAETQHRVRQDVVRFTSKGQAVKLWLNAWTHLPTGVELIRNDPSGIWGDVTERRWYSYWTLEAGGLMYPRQTTVEWNGLPYTDDTVMSLALDAPVDEAAFAVPAETRAAYEKLAGQGVGLATLRFDETRAVPLTDRVLQLQGGFNVGVVRQPDGLVILEGTTSTAYSDQVIEFLARRFSNVPVKAMVTTSDAWPHIGGVRSYVARGVPIYPLDLNVSILTRLIEAPRTIVLDPPSMKRRAPIFRPVTGRTTIGSGETRVELIPVRGEYGERMMIAWLPGPKLLYSSDLIQPGRTRGTFFMPAMLAEVAAAVERERIAGIDRVFGMHLPPTPWMQVLEAIQEAKAAR